MTGTDRQAGVETARCRVDLLAICGIAAILMPLLTMAHEIGGHAAACLATHGKLTEIGTFYVDCDSANLAAKRIVSLAGPIMDIALSIVFFAIWSGRQTDLARLIWWYCWLSCGFEAAGYLLFSGILGLGDLGPSGDGGLAPLSHPLIWQGLMAATGLICYVLLVAAGQHTLSQIIGRGLATRNTRRKIALGFYGSYGLAAILASLANPKGLDIILTSAMASSFGALAGMINIGFGARGDGAGTDFTIKPNVPMVGCGIILLGLFAVLLGPTIKLGAPP
jgi:hypothetical protein